MAKGKNKTAVKGNSVDAAPVATEVSLPVPPPSFFPGKVSLFIHMAIAGVIAVITGLVLKNCLDNQFTDWDDAGYIVNNPIVKDISATGLKTIFTAPVMGNYHPLTILSYALEYANAELEPWLYHFDSLLLHIIVTLLVYVFVNLLTRRPVAAAVAALLFGLHPMHVESVAWVAGRKDLLCAVFYVAACIAYICYLRAAEGRRQIWYASVIILFVCSVLSKPVSVTLPVVLLLIDSFEQREWTKKVFLEKIPHFLIALFFGVVSVRIQHGGGAMDVQPVHFNFMERIALGGYALVTYLYKSVVPVHLICFYPYPQKVNDMLPLYYFIYPLVAAAVVFVAWSYWRRNRFVVFGLLFFLVNIALLLQFIPVGEAIVAERYSYIPYLGLFFVAGWLASLCFGPGVKQVISYVALAAMLLYAVVLGYTSSVRCTVWYDATTLWSDELQKEPVHAPIAYNNLGFAYFGKKNAATDATERQIYFDSAYYLISKAIELKPDFVNAWQGLGMLCYMKGDFTASANCFRTAVQLRPVAENYSDYANLLLQLGKTDSALMEYNRAVALNPDLYVARLNRAKLYKSLNRNDEAIADLDKAVLLNPEGAEAYYVRALCHAQKANRAQALADVEKAIALKYQLVDNNFYQGLKN